MSLWITKQDKEKYKMKKYKLLNEIAEQGGIVIFGGSEDLNIPLCELKQAFALKENYYNRSVENISILKAAEFYESYVAELHPETVLLHMGDTDIEMFSKSPNEFADNYRKLILQIRKENKKCRIAIVSLKNYDGNTNITELNKHLKYIADSEKCEFFDISEKKVWNPKQTKDVVSFVYDIGFLHPLKNKRPIYDLVKMLFCFY